MSKIAVLIPCYNESLTIAKVVSDYHAALPEANIYVYDNDSNDGTDAIARDAGAIVRYERQRGKGNVIHRMFREINADCYLLIDGDDTYPADHAREMTDLVLYGGYDMVIGDRLSNTYFQENKRLFHNSGNKLVRQLVNLFFHGNVTDIMTGCRACSRAFVKGFPVTTHGFEIETEMTIHALDTNCAITSVPVNYRDRPNGSVSKLNTFSDGFRVIRIIAQLVRDYKPLPFFGSLFLLLSFFAVVLIIPVLVEYSQTGLVPRLPTFVAGCFLLVFALLFLMCGLILDTNAKKHKRNYEIQMNILHLLEEIQADRESARL